ncbi:hypothetical protein JTB14_006405 [Gonioctena quinquepunctata]|nr:hypothetical protein JTB14_006405 [Gonioctena quinquepunctata]
MDLLEFRLSLGEYLVAVTKKRVLEETDKEDNSENDINQGNKIKKRRVAASLPCVDKRFDGFEHWPNNEDMKNTVKCRTEIGPNSSLGLPIDLNQQNILEKSMDQMQKRTPVQGKNLQSLINQRIVR